MATNNKARLVHSGLSNASIRWLSSVILRLDSQFRRNQLERCNALGVAGNRIAK
jgi:hypothetical protein